MHTSLYHLPDGAPEHAAALLTAPVATEHPAHQRALRRLHTAREWAEPGSTLARCGQERGPGTLAVVRGPGGSHRIDGLVRCRSAWACPVCAPAVRWRHECRLRRALDHLAAERGTQPCMATFTVPHHKDEPLSDVLGGVGAAWAKVTAGRRWELAHERFGLAGWVRGTEVTIGPNGWHPHLHVGLVTQPGADHAEMAEWLVARWRAACVAVGLPAPSPTIGVVVSQPAEHTAGYLVRLATEVARFDVKGGRGAAHFGALQLLDLAGTSRDAWARAAWGEYVTTTRGRRPVVFSAGLSQAVAATPDEQTDTDPTANDWAAPLLVGRLTPAQWAALVRTPYGLANALALLDDGQEGAAAAVLDAAASLAGSADHGRPLGRGSEFTDGLARPFSPQTSPK